MWREQYVGGRRRVAAMARPWVVRGIFYHPGTKRVEFDVALAAQEVGVVHDRTGCVPAFPQRSSSAVAIVDVTHVAAAERLHHAAPSGAWHRARSCRRTCSATGSTTPR